APLPPVLLIRAEFRRCGSFRDFDAGPDVDRYNQPMHPAIFLDRDGVIIENRPAYVRSWEDVEIFPQALTALARVCKSPYKIVIVTIQSGVGPGLIQMETAEEINRRLVREIEKAGGRIDAVLMCPHAPE